MTDLEKAAKEIREYVAYAGTVWPEPDGFSVPWKLLKRLIEALPKEEK